jgi:hypothetical protein
MTGPKHDTIDSLTPNTITWEIVQVLADGYWRTSGGIIEQLELRGTNFTSVGGVTNLISRLCRRGIVECRPYEYRIKRGATFMLGEGI